MLRTVFIGSQNRFDEMLVHWLSQRTEVAGVVWTQSSAWRASWRGRLGFAARRARRRGILKAADEAAFHLWYHRFEHARDAAELQRRVLEPYHREHGAPRWSGDAIKTDDINSEAVRGFLEDRRPDVAFAVCLATLFSKKLRNIPTHGTLLWHEGFTPEYRGLYSPFWAAHNLDLDRIGCTVLRMDDVLDGGEPLVRVPARDVDPRVHGHLYMGHKAIADSLPAVEHLLEQIEAGDPRPIGLAGAPSGYYSYPGLSDLIRQRRRLRRA